MFAVVCAHNPGKKNLGMYSVDLAARDFFSKSRIPYDLVKLAGHDRVGQLNFRKISTADELLRYKNIVFWGDFQQNPIWGKKNFSARASKDYRISRDSAFDLWKSLCLLREAESLADHNVYSVGTCFLGLGNALQTSGFGDEYRRLMSRFRAIVPRDEGSFAELGELGLHNVLQGFDCASLIDHARRPARKTHRFAYAFGRTIKSAEAKALVRNLETELGSRGTQVKWLLDQFYLLGPANRYSRALNVLNDVDFVVTDIYHLTINSINIGKHVFCIGRKEGDFLDTCDDHKKAVLMKMIGKSANYIELPETTGDSATYLSRQIAERSEIALGESADAGFDARKEQHRSTLRQLFAAHGG